MPETALASRKKLFPNATVREVPAIGRAFAILRFLAQSNEAVGVQACARAVGLIPSTCLHILRALVVEGMVVFNPTTKRYRLGMGMLTIASAGLRHGEHRRVIQDALDRVAVSCGVTTLIANIVDQEHSVVIALSHGVQPMRFNVGIGSRYPALIGASGRCVAAFSGIPDSTLLRTAAKLRWSRAPTPGQWKREIAFTRANGYAVDAGDYIEGATVISVPVFDAAGAVASTVAAVGLSKQVASVGVAKVAAELKQIARDVATLELTSASTHVAAAPN